MLNNGKTFKKAAICEYDGSQYAGWQYQINSPTVQGEIEKALYIFYNETVRLLGSGRTDTGVHALGQVFHFSTEIYRENQNIIDALNSLTPTDITILDVWDVPNDFHAIASAKSKTYLYRIYNRGYAPALYQNRVWWVRNLIDIEKLNEYLQLLTGTHDFSSFCPIKSLKDSNIRTVNFIEVSQTENMIDIRINANGFLHNMVRVIVGTAVFLYLKGVDPKEVDNILEAKDRRFAKKTAPAEGLYLEKVYY